jgi:hypothetical protein
MGWVSVGASTPSLSASAFPRRRPLSVQAHRDQTDPGAQWPPGNPTGVTGAFVGLPATSPADMSKTARRLAYGFWRLLGCKGSPARWSPRPPETLMDLPDPGACGNQMGQTLRDG